VTVPVFNLPTDAEYWRLRALEDAYDPPTLRILDSTGVAPGWRCLDLGAGTGSIALALHARTGSVIALDRDAQYIRHLESPTFRVVEAAVEHAELPPDRDLVHCRFLLDLVSDPRAVLESFRECIRPGRWLVLGEFDDVTATTGMGVSRAVTLHNEVLSAKEAAWQKRGHDTLLGRKLPVWLIEMGFVAVESECGCRVRMSGTPGAYAWRQSLLAMRDSILEEGFQADDFDEYLRILDEPGFSYFSPLVVRVVGQKPK
jgi:SAM-dependent methyltransferase